MSRGAVSLYKVLTRTLSLRSALAQIDRPDRRLRFILLTFVGLILLNVPVLAATPAFSVHKNGTTQSVATDTDTKLTWSTEAFDTNNNFASDRFTPTVAGKYLIVVSVQCTQAGQCVPAIYENGTPLARSQSTNFNIGQTPQLTAIVDMNGTTDYIEAFVTSSGNSIGGTANRTYFSGMQLDGSGGSFQWTDVTGGINYAGGKVGINVASPASTLHVMTPAPATQGVSRNTVLNTPNRTVAVNETNYLLGLDVNENALRANIASGATDSGYRIAGRLQGEVNDTNFSGTLAEAVGLDVQAGIYAAAASGPRTITNAYGIRITNFTNAGTITNNYGLYQGSAAAKNYFAGNVGIGTSSPGARLDVGGPGNSSTLRVNGFTLNDDNLNTGLANNNAGALLFYNNVGTANSNMAYRFHVTTSGTPALDILNNGNVGIGTTSPVTRLSIVGEGSTYALAVENTGTGDGIRISTAESTSNNGLYWSQGANAMANLFSSNNSAILRLAGGNVTKVELNTIGASYFTGGDVGIGVTSPTHILHISGQGRATNSAWATSSDARVKEDVHTITGGLGLIDSLRPVTFRYTDEYQNGNPALAGLRRGFIAQEVEAVLPDAVTRAVEKVGKREIDDFRVLGNGDFVPLLVSAVKELKAANDNLKAENDELRAELRETINSQDAEIDALRRDIEALSAAR